jgi:hypothetical protein
MADLIFAFDPAIDRPLPVPEDAPPAVVEAIAQAAFDALDEAVAAARKSGAAALVLCGRVLDPQRASPAQAARLRKIVVELAAQGCRTVSVAADAAACNDLSRMLGEPSGLHFVTPLAPLEFDVRGLLVEIVSAHGPAAVAAGTAVSAVAPAPLHRRIVIGWDSALWHSERWDGLDIAGRGTHDHAHPALATDEAARPHAPMFTAAAFAATAAASPAWSHPGSFWIWGSRRRQHVPAGVHHLPALQARSGHEADPGACCGLTLLDRGAAEAADGPFAAPHADWRSSWEEIPTHRVAWRALSIESAAGGDEELATAIWAALEAHTPGKHAPLEIVRCSVECGTSVARRVRVAEIAAETLARVRQLYDAKTFRVWCRELVADPGESLAPLGHARSGSRPGTTTSFSSALADIVSRIEQSPAPAIPADMAREAGWLALELVEST